MYLFFGVVYMFVCVRACMCINVHIHSGCACVCGSYKLMLRTFSRLFFTLTFEAGLSLSLVFGDLARLAGQPDPDI